MEKFIQRILEDCSLEKFSRMCCLPLSRLLTIISPKNDCPDLNDDTVEKILGRLPVPSLLRAKTVCKSWNTAISSPSFNAEDHIHHGYFVVELDNENIALFSSALNRWFQIPLPSCRDGFLAAEAEGIYLFIEWNTNYSMIIVNPVTKQQRSLPPLPYNWDQMAVELVAHSDHIEIITIGFHKREPSYLCALIYSSVSNQWRNAPLMRDAFPFINFWGARYCGTSALHDGMVYIASESGKHLACYDIKSGDFQLRRIAGGFPLGDFHYYSMPSLVSCGGKLLLGVPVKVLGDEETLVGIWGLEKDKDNDNAWSWSRISFTPHDLIERSLGTSDFMVAAASDKIWLTIKGCRNLMTFDIHSMKWNVLPRCPAQYVFDIFPIPRRAVWGTLSLHNKLPLFD